jgi:hypothetical protein
VFHKYTRWFKYDQVWFFFKNHNCLRSHSCCAVRLVYTQISPGHIWITLYYWPPRIMSFPTGSSPDEVDFFNWPNPSSRTMALGSTQTLTEMSTRKIPGG